MLMGLSGMELEFTFYAQGKIDVLRNVDDDDDAGE